MNESEILTVITIIVFILLIFSLGYALGNKEQKKFTDYWFQEYSKMKQNFLTTSTELLNSKKIKKVK